MGKPIASKGYLSYRYKGRFGYIMIGASSHGEALSEANRSLTSEVAILENLELWNGSMFMACMDQ